MHRAPMPLKRACRHRAHAGRRRAPQWQVRTRWHTREHRGARCPEPAGRARRHAEASRGWRADVIATGRARSADGRAKPRPRGTTDTTPRPPPITGATHRPHGLIGTHQRNSNARNATSCTCDARTAPVVNVRTGAGGRAHAVGVMPVGAHGVGCAHGATPHATAPMPATCLTLAFCCRALP